MKEDIGHDAKRAIDEAAYLEAYPHFISTLSRQQRKDLAKGGLLRPNLAATRRPTKNEPAMDAADSNAASYCPDFSDIDNFRDVLRDLGVPEKASATVSVMVLKFVEEQSARNDAQRLQAIVAEFLSSGNPLLSAYSLAFAGELDALNDLGSQAEAAAKCGVTRAAISKGKVRWQEILGLPCGAHGKTSSNRENYSKAQREDHWRNRKFQCD